MIQYKISIQCKPTYNNKLLKQVKEERNMIQYKPTNKSKLLKQVKEERRKKFE